MLNFENVDYESISKFIIDENQGQGKIRLIQTNILLFDQYFNINYY